MTYSITGGTGAALFAIDTNTGVVTVNGVIDREALGPSVTLQITATSQDSSTANQTFVIDVNDVDEFDPEFGANDYPATVAENINDTTVIATVGATDDDATAAVTYSIKRNNPHLEAFKERGIEVLLLTDRLDEWVMQHLTEYGGKPCKDVRRGVLDLAGGGGRRAEGRAAGPRAASSC